MRGADTNTNGGDLNKTPGEGVCVSHVAACAVLRLPAPSEAPPDALVPAEGRADHAAAWVHAHFTSSAFFRALCLAGLQRARAGRQAPARPMAASLRPQASSPGCHFWLFAPF